MLKYLYCDCYCNFPMRRDDQQAWGSLLPCCCTRGRLTTGHAMMLYSGARRPTAAALLLISAWISTLNTGSVVAFLGGTFPRGIPLCCEASPGQLSSSSWSRGSGGGVREACRRSRMRRKLDMISKPSQVLVAGAAGQLGQRIVRYGTLHVALLDVHEIFGQE